MSDEKFTFFWHGPFSQWHLGNPFVIDGITYNCAEQWMMACKARLFKDDETLQKILAETDPKKQKRLGKQVKGLQGGKWTADDIAFWNAHAKAFVYEGNYAKYTQHKELLNELLATAGTTLVEASPFDAIWGIKLAANDERAQSRETWQGMNWLGEVLTTLREDLICRPLS